MPIGATGQNRISAAFHQTHHSTAAKWPTDRWSDASNAFHGLDKRLAGLNELANSVRRVDPAPVKELIAAHLAARELRRQYESVQMMPNSVLFREQDLPPGPQRDEVISRADAFENANTRLDEAIDQMGYALKTAMHDRLHPEYTKTGTALFHPNEAISTLCHYLRTGQPPADQGGPAAPRPPLGTDAAIPQLQALQEKLKLKLVDSYFIDLATEKLPRLAVFAAGTNGARPEQVQGLDAQFKRAAQLRDQLPRLEDIKTPLSAADLEVLSARILDYRRAVSGAWTRAETLREDMLNHARYETKAHPVGQDQATRALGDLAQMAARRVPPEGSSESSDPLRFTLRAYAVNEALRDMRPEHGSALAEQLWRMDITHRALMSNRELKQRCPDDVRVGNKRSDPVCNVIHSDLTSLELGVSFRGTSVGTSFTLDKVDVGGTIRPVPADPPPASPPPASAPHAPAPPVNAGNGEPSNPAPGGPEEPKSPQDGAVKEPYKKGLYTARMFQGGTPDQLQMKKMLTGPDQLWSLGMRRAEEYLGLRPAGPVQVDFEVRDIDGELGIEARAELKNGKYKIEVDSADVPLPRELKAFETTIAHEGFHIAEFATLGFGLAADAWFGEGCAEFVGGGDATLAAHLDHFGNAQKIIENFPARDVNFYPASYVAVRYMHHQIRQAGGVNGVRHIFDLLQANPGATFDDAMSHLARQLGGPVKGYVTQQAFIDDFKRNGAEFIKKMNLTNDDLGAIGGRDAAAL